MQERPLNTPTKFEFATSSIEHVSSVERDDQRNVEYLHLKHFLDSDDEITRPGNLLSKTSSRCNSPDSTTTGEYIKLINMQSMYEYN